ncbi:diguanylate cyclase [Actinoplanes sp. NPDC051859]|uniref:diguanylate cyclase n=1 Tax=Actinoplanes sp. NPDC051859 TaxID=3363909 RepID=UPI003797BAE9
MLLRTVYAGFGVRDLHGASRAVAYLVLAAAPYVLITGTLAPGITLSGRIAVIAVVSFMAGLGLMSWFRPHLLPVAFWFFVPILSTVLITGLNMITNDASTGAQFFYLWPVLYVANFLGRRAIYLNLLLVFAGDALTVFTVLGVGRGMMDWVATMLTMTMTTIVVSTLRARADKFRAVLEEQANVDALTGLANRRHFTETLTREAAEIALTGDSLALVTVDLDYFKTINDTYGHTEGDRVLQAVASSMRTVTGDRGLAARLGGDEFVMLLRLDRPAAVAVAQELRADAGSATGLPGGPPSLSIGIAVLPGDAATVEELISASDAALYDAKASGRGRVAVARGRQNLDRMPGLTPTPDPLLRP